MMIKFCCNQHPRMPQAASSFYIEWPEMKVEQGLVSAFHLHSIDLQHGEVYDCATKLS